jgi:hypothetical protein
MKRIIFEWMKEEDVFSDDTMNRWALMKTRIRSMSSV